MLQKIITIIGTSQIKIVEVGPRDGLQNINHAILSAETKAIYIDKLLVAGIKNIEIRSFVSDKVLQMKNTDDVLKLINKHKYSNIKYIALVPNVRYAQKALNCGVNELAVFTSVSNEFCEKNNGCSLQKSMERISNIICLAKQHDVCVRGYLSCVFGCPFDGYDETYIKKVTDTTKQLLELGCYEVSLGDTIGTATPKLINSTLSFMKNEIPINKIGIHLHDPYGIAILNLITALHNGITIIDASTGNIGGCPVTKNPGANISTEEVINLLNMMKISHGIDVNKLCDASYYINNSLVLSKL